MIFTDIYTSKSTFYHAWPLYSLFHKVPILLQRLVDTARQVATRLTPELFERLREKREKRFLDFLVSQPYRHAMNAAELCIDRPKWDILKRLECVKEVTLLDLQQFAPRLLSRFLAQPCSRSSSFESACQCYL